MPCVTTETCDVEAVKAGLRGEFPGWSVIFTRDTGRWWAIRWPPLDGRRDAHVVTDLDAETPELLRERLQEVADAEKSVGV